MVAYDSMSRAELIETIRSLESRLASAAIGTDGASGDVARFPEFGDQERREFENNPSPIRIFDRETLKYLAVNDAALKLYGYSREEFLEMTALDTRHPDEGLEFFAMLTEPSGYLRDVRPRKHLRKSGEVIIVEIVAQDIRFNGRAARLNLTLDVTERSRTDALLHKREQEFSALVENAPDIIARFDRELRHTYVNPPVAAATGIARDAFVGKTHRELGLPEKLVAYWEQEIRRVFESGEGRNIEFECLCNGRTRYFEARMVPELRPEGAIASVLAIARDVTERKQTDRALRANEEFLHRVIESSSDCIKVFDLEGRLQSMSRGGQRLLDIDDINPLLGMWWLEFWRGADHEAAARALAAGRKGDSASFEGYCPTLKGEPKWWDVVISPIMGPDGRAERLLAVSRDITARKQAEDELRRQKKLLDAIIDNLPVGVFMRDAQTSCFLMRNRFAQERFGYAIGASRGETVYDLYPEELARRMHETDWQAFNTGQMVEIPEQLVPGPHGDTRIQHVRKVPVFDEQGQPWVLVGIADDITERRRAEAELANRQRMLDAIIEHLPVGIVVKDARTLRNLLRNRMAMELTGLSSTETIGRRADEVYPPELVELIDASDREALATGRAVTVSPQLVFRRTGRIVRSTKVPVPDETGRYTHLVGMMVDLTDIERAQVALCRSEQRLRQLISMSPAAIFSFSLDPPLGTTFISENVIAQVGWQPSDFIDNPTFWLDHVHPEDRARAEEAMSRIAVEGKYACEYRFRHQDGSWRWMRDEGQMVRDAESRPREAIGIWMDITAERLEADERVQQALRQRDVLVREVHHRIKNHLQGIAGLLRQKANGNPAIANLVETAVAQLHSVATIYGLQGESAASGVSLPRVLAAICSSVESLIGGHITCAFADAAGALRLAETEAVPVAVALNELVLNALKHHARDNGEAAIEVACVEEGERAEIRIVNRGKLPPGFDYVRGMETGTGLDLVRTLLASQGSKLSFCQRGDKVETMLRLGAPVVGAVAAVPLERVA